MSVAIFHYQDIEINIYYLYTIIQRTSLPSFVSIGMVV